MEVNLKKGKISQILKNNKTQDAYDKFIDALDKSYNVKVCRTLSQLDTPIIAVGYRHRSYSSLPVVYCFNENYYIMIDARTTITSDLEQVLEIIDKHFYE